MDERIQFIADYLTGGLTMTELVPAVWGQSADGVCSWCARYQADGRGGA